MSPVSSCFTTDSPQVTHALQVENGTNIYSAEAKVWSLKAGRRKGSYSTLVSFGSSAGDIPCWEFQLPEEVLSVLDSSVGREKSDKTIKVSPPPREAEALDSVW